VASSVGIVAILGLVIVLLGLLGKLKTIRTIFIILVGMALFYGVMYLYEPVRIPLIYDLLEWFFSSIPDLFREAVEYLKRFMP